MKKAKLQEDANRRRGSTKREAELENALLEAAMQDEHVRFYNHPRADPKIEYWGRRAWLLDQAVALSLNKDPDIVSTKSLAGLTPVWPFARQYMDRRRTFERIFIDDEWNHVSPNDMIEAAEKAGIEFPTKLVELVRSDVDKRRNAANPVGQYQTASALESRVHDLEAENADLRAKLKKRQEQNPKALRTTNVLLYALGKKYRYSLDHRNSAAANIQKSLQALDVTIDEGVVRSRLAEAFRHILRDERPGE